VTISERMTLPARVSEHAPQNSSSPSPYFLPDLTGNIIQEAQQCSDCLLQLVGNMRSGLVYKARQEISDGLKTNTASAAFWAKQRLLHYNGLYTCPVPPTRASITLSSVRPVSRPNQRLLGLSSQLSQQKSPRRGVAYYCG